MGAGTLVDVLVPVRPSDQPSFIGRAGTSLGVPVRRSFEPSFIGRAGTSGTYRFGCLTRLRFMGVPVPL